MLRFVFLLFLIACAHPTGGTTPPPAGDEDTPRAEAQPDPTSAPPTPPATLGLGPIPTTPLAMVLPGGEMVLVVLDGGGVSSHLASEPPPSEANVQLMDCERGGCVWSLASPTESDLFALGPDGLFRMGPGADFLQMVCRLEGESLACTCDGHSPEIDLRCSVHGAQVTCQSGMFSAAGAELDPAPATREERVRALFLLAEFLMSHDAGEHDGDAGVFGPEY